MRLIRLRKLLKKYHDGTATDAERLVVDVWYEGFDETAIVPPGLDGEGDRSAMRARLWTGIRKRNKPLSWYRSGLVRVAAVIMLVTSLAVLFYLINGGGGHRSRLDAASAKLPEVITTGSKQLKYIQLPDSTRVWLNANSRLEVSPGYGATKRDISLLGEAFFEVKRDTLRPFVVTTRNIAVKVLGTSFNIQSYEHPQTVHVVVNSGEVSVTDSSSRQLAQLAANEGLTYDPMDGSVRVGPRMAGDSHHWRSGVVILERAPFGQLVQSFRNLYGVELVTADAGVASYRYNITLRSTMRLDEAIGLISSILDKHYRKEENGTIRLY